MLESVAEQAQKGPIESMAGTVSGRRRLVTAARAGHQRRAECAIAHPHPGKLVAVSRPGFIIRTSIINY